MSCIHSVYKAIGILFVCGAAFSTAAPVSASEFPVVIHSTKASLAEQLAAREVCRYVYVRTGVLLPIVVSDTVPLLPHGGVVVGRQDRPVVRSAATRLRAGNTVAALRAQQYVLKSTPGTGKRLVVIAGGDDAGVLYGAYQFAEYLGVRFYLHGDVVPDTLMELALPEVDAIGRPLFEHRGIQPFHDFPEGPDWWNIDDYKAILSQLPKLRMNFFGLHTYPENNVGPEPTVWIGTADEIGEDGNVTASYPSRHFTTHSGTWGSKPKNTSDFSLGASAMFERDAFGADYMEGMTPWPATPDDCNKVFNDFGALLREAFHHAYTLGIQTCVGTETPLIIPKVVRERLQATGRDPADPAVVQEIYEGMFRRIAAAHPLNYYWFWTPEGWTWSGATDAQVQATLDDLKAAITAAKAVDAPFTLATCGWVLGPPQDRALFDKALPKTMPMSCINRQVGKDPVEPGFKNVRGRPKWAIPWLEDDPAMTIPQLWVGRMRRDAFDALRYGCTGLMGIHWRTRILGPNVSALARAAWDQSGWSDGAGELVEPPCAEGVVGGKVVDYARSTIADTEDDPLYRCVRYDVAGYRIGVPDGTYNVTLKFCEPAYSEAGKRVFGVDIQGKECIRGLDMFAEVGKSRALDRTFEGIKVSGGTLRIDFLYEIEYPCIAGIVVAGDGVVRQINCGGTVYKDFEADLGSCPGPARDLPAESFYLDWACTQFGADVGPRIAAIFDRMDGRLPEPATWVRGPGGMQPDGQPWAEVRKAYAFVDELAALRAEVDGAGSLERFDYWLENFRYMRAMGELRCAWGRFNAAMVAVDAEGDAEAKKALARETALPIRKEIIALVGQVYQHLLATVKTVGEMGTVANWEQHVQDIVLDGPGGALANALGEPLPADAQLPTGYTGPTRAFVPTMRTSLYAGEPLRLKVIVLAEVLPASTVFCWRPMGEDAYREMPLTHVDRGVYRVELAGGSIPADGLEYYVRIAGTDREVSIPATAPLIGHTVVVTPPMD